MRVQVELFAERELSFLESQGLGEREGHVLDLGCGAGFFLDRLRQRFPDKRIVGVDQHEALLDRCKRRNLSEGRTTETFLWNVGVDPCPYDDMTNVSDVLMRLVLQHVEQPATLLQRLKKELQPGTRVYVIEEDDTFFQFAPDLTALNRVVRAWRDYGARHGNDRFIGSKLARLFSQAGYKVCFAQVASQSQFDVGLQEMLAYFEATAQMIHTSSPDVLASDEIAEIKASFAKMLEKPHQDIFVYYPQVLFVAKV